MLKSILVLIVLKSSLAFAVSPSSQSKKEIKQNPEVQPIIYEVRKGNDRAYILGTMHYGVEFGHFPSFVRKFAMKADTLVFETDMLEAQQIMIREKSNLKTPLNLKNQLSAKEWANFEKALKPTLGGDMKQAEQLTVLEASTIHTLSLLPQTQQPIDTFLFVLAKTSGKSLKFFEEPQIQIDLLKNILTLETFKQQLSIPYKQAKDYSNKMVELYTNGDVDQLHNLISEASKVSPEQAKAMDATFDKRNKTWVSKFDKIFNTSGVEFMAVGAGHLPGENGLVKLLKKKGYSVVRYKLPGAAPAQRNISSQ